MLGRIRNMRWTPKYASRVDSTFRLPGGGRTHESCPVQTMRVAILRLRSGGFRPGHGRDSLGRHLGSDGEAVALTGLESVVIGVAVTVTSPMAVVRSGMALGGLVAVGVPAAAGVL
jgi:hypothetical protein